MNHVSIVAFFECLHIDFQINTHVNGTEGPSNANYNGAPVVIVREHEWNVKYFVLFGRVND